MAFYLRQNIIVLLLWWCFSAVDATSPTPKPKPKPTPKPTPRPTPTPTIAKPRVVAWYTGQYASYPPEAIDFTVVTHVVYGGIEWHANDTGTALPCKGPINNTVQELVKKHGAKLQFVAPGFLVDAVYDMEMRGRLMGSIREAMQSCGYDGMEFDWEGPSTPEVADQFTSFLIELRAAIGPEAVISADSEPPMWNPPDYYWLNATKMDGVNLDFVNYMVYYAGNGNHTIVPWVEAAGMLIRMGYPPSTVNLAVPNYAPSTQGTWRGLCAECPNLDPASNQCGTTMIAGKETNKAIGELIRFSGLGGAFPWMLDYDVAPTDNTTCGDNSMFKWLKKGLRPDLA